MASRKPEQLAPKLQTAWNTLDKEMTEAGYDAILTCTHRSNEEQDKLYAQGRSEPGPRVTNAKAGQSKHNLVPAQAFDIAIMVNGKLDWNTNGLAWRKAAEIGKRLGLHQLSFEKCHFEF
jgi:peptidoglycan L-alanyl-D-glutamate endopeptidase CwlK